MSYLTLALVLVSFARLDDDIVKTSIGPTLIDKNICGPLSLAAASTSLGRPDLFDEIFRLLPPSVPRSGRRGAQTRIPLRLAEVAARFTIPVIRPCDNPPGG